MTNSIETILANRVVSQLETGGFIFTERKHKPYSVYSSHSHGLTSLGILYQGSFTETVGRKSQECLPGSLQLLPKGEHHSYMFNKSDVCCLTIEIKSHRLQEISRFSKGLNEPLYFREGVLLPVKRLYREFCSKDQTSSLILEGILFEILGNVDRAVTRLTLPVEPKWLRRAKDFIHENALNGVSLASAATLAEVHPSYLARAFRKFYDCSIGDYVRKVRVDHAIDQILTTNKTLSEIGISCGFYDQSHFSSAFKLLMKMTPGQFRSSSRS